MAIRKTQEEEFFVASAINDLIPKCQKALEDGNFKNIKFNQLLSTFEADYKTFTVIGNLNLTLVPQNDGVVLKLKSTANVDNIFALLKSPNGIILSKFKDNLS
jgi:hypothetical protein